MVTFTCSECSEEKTVDEMPARGPICFRCHVQGIKFGFVSGGGYGKSVWNDHTIKSYHDETVAGAKAAGVKLQPVGTRWV